MEAVYLENEVLSASAGVLGAPPVLEGERGWALSGPVSHFFPGAGQEP